MRVIVLIAANFLREQRWPLILLLVWVVFSGAAAGFASFERDDALFFIKQQAIYGVAFAGFVAASAIHNERRSRRILAVLSKGVERSRYLAGLLSGVLAGVVIYCGAMALFGSMMLGPLRIPETQLAAVLIALLAACLVAATTGLVFATFLPPLVAIAFTGITLAASPVLAMAGVTAKFLPVYALMDSITSFGTQPHWTPPWNTMAWAVPQAAALWLLAAAIFARRDIAVQVE
jgi:hypothetical protein